MELARQQHERKMVAGACMVLSPLVLLGAWVLTPPLARDETTALRAIAGGTGRATAGVVLSVAGLALAVFAVLGVVHLLRERIPRAGQLGGAAALVGLVGAVLNLGIQASAIEIAKAGVTAPNVATYKDIVTGPIGTVAMACGVLLALGVFTMAVALYRAEAAPRVSAALFGLFAIGDIVGFATMSSFVVIAAMAALVLGLGSMGVAVLTESDAQWDHTPRYHGIHGVAA